jgi:hypothetical protein
LPSAAIASRHAECHGVLGHVLGWFDAEAGDPALHEVLQQIPVVRRQFDDEAVGAEPESIGDHLDVVLAVLQEAG